MDVRMPRLDGIEATRRICQAGERPRVLMLTTFDLDEYAYAALKAGASGFLLKDVPPEELLFGIRAVHSGDAVVAPSTTRRLIDRFAPLFPADDGPAPPGLDCLTSREREVLAHVAQGLSNAEIAGRLFVSEATVKTHVGRVLAKLGLRDRVQAVVLRLRDRPGQGARPRRSRRVQRCRSGLAARWRGAATSPSAAITATGSSHQAFTEATCTSRAVAARATATTAAPRQSSPMTKSYQNAPNERSHLLMRHSFPRGRRWPGPPRRPGAAGPGSRARPGPSPG